MQIRKVHSGRTMVEMLGILAIVGVLSIAALLIYSVLIQHYKANEILNHVRLLGGSIVFRNKEYALNEMIPVGDFADDKRIVNEMSAQQLRPHQFAVIVDDVDAMVCYRILDKAQTAYEIEVRHGDDTWRGFSVEAQNYGICGTSGYSDMRFYFDTESYRHIPPEVQECETADESEECCHHFHPTWAYIDGQCVDLGCGECQRWDDELSECVNDDTILPSNHETDCTTCVSGTVTYPTLGNCQQCSNGLVITITDTEACCTAAGYEWNPKINDADEEGFCCPEGTRYASGDDVCCTTTNLVNNTCCASEGGDIQSKRICCEHVNRLWAEGEAAGSQCCQADHVVSSGHCCPSGYTWDGHQCVHSCDPCYRWENDETGCVQDLTQRNTVPGCCALFGGNWLEVDNGGVIEGHCCAVGSGVDSEEVWADRDQMCCLPANVVDGYCCTSHALSDVRACCLHAGHVWAEDESVGSQCCPTGYIVSFGHCCPTGYVWDGKQCIPSCDDCYAWNGEKCAPDASQKNSSESCCALFGGAWIDQDEGGICCNDAQESEACCEKFVGSGKWAESEVTGSQCCPEDQIASEGHCCPAGESVATQQVWATADNMCCPSSEVFNGYCCSSHLSSEVEACCVKEGRLWAADEPAGSQCCQKGYIVSFGHCCPSGHVWNGLQCIPSCDPCYKWNGTKCAEDFTQKNETSECCRKFGGQWIAQGESGMCCSNAQENETCCNALSENGVWAENEITGSQCCDADKVVSEGHCCPAGTSVETQQVWTDKDNTCCLPNKVADGYCCSNHSVGDHEACCLKEGRLWATAEPEGSQCCEANQIVSLGHCCPQYHYWNPLRKICAPACDSCYKWDGTTCVEDPTQKDHSATCCRKYGGTWVGEREGAECCDSAQDSELCCENLSSGGMWAENEAAGAQCCAEDEVASAGHCCPAGSSFATQQVWSSKDNMCCLPGNLADEYCCSEHSDNDLEACCKLHNKTYDSAGKVCCNKDTDSAGCCKAMHLSGNYELITVNNQKQCVPECLECQTRNTNGKCVTDDSKTLSSKTCCEKANRHWVGDKTTGSCCASGCYIQTTGQCMAVSIPHCSQAKSGEYCYGKSYDEAIGDEKKTRKCRDEHLPSGYRTALADCEANGADMVSTCALSGCVGSNIYAGGAYMVDSLSTGNATECGNVSKQNVLFCYPNGGSSSHTANPTINHNYKSNRGLCRKR